MWQRLKNLWAWSAIAPNGVKFGDFADIEKGLERIPDAPPNWRPGGVSRKIFEPVDSPTQIIYPNEREELLKVKSDPTLDELLNV